MHAPTYSFYILLSIQLDSSQYDRDLSVLKTQGVKINIKKVHTALQKLHNIFAEGMMYFLIIWQHNFFLFPPLFKKNIASRTFNNIFYQ